MKVKVHIAISANYHARMEREIDVEDLGYSPEEWKKLDEVTKQQAAVDYWHENGAPEIWVTESEAESD